MRQKKTNNLFQYILVIAVLLAVITGGVEILRRAAMRSEQPAANVVNSAQSFPRTIKDASGSSLIVETKPNRIVSQTLGTDEILLDICEPERIIGISSLAEDANYSNVVEKAKMISGRATQGAEQILQMRPDLIFVASYSRAETVELLRAAKAPIFRFSNFDSIEDVKTNVRTIGFAAGCDEKAADLTRQMESELEQIRRTIPAGKQPRVMSFTGNYTAGKNTLFDSIIRAAGAVNVSAEKGIEGFAKISSEEILEWQPDFIVTGANSNEVSSKAAQLLADPIIAASNAGTAKRVIAMDNRYFLTVSNYVVRAVETLTDALYGNEKRNS